MKTVKNISEGSNHTAIELGRFGQLHEYSFMHPKRHQEVKGKVFVGEILKSTAAELSFTVIPPNTEIPFIHQHHQHEEIYVFIKGSGQFQVDGSIFDVTEGSVIRISPNGKRTYRNNSELPMTFICIQCQSDSFKNFVVADGFRVDEEINWGK